MTPQYVDLHLHPDLRDIDQVEGMIGKASDLGYALIAIPVSINFSPSKIGQIRNICKQYSIDPVSRLDLKPRNPRELIKSLRKWRRKFEVIAVICRSKSVARQAAKDRRVDLVNFPSPDPRRRFFDSAEAELACHALTSLEIDVNPLLTLQGKRRIRLISALRREAAIADQFNVPLVLSSAAPQILLMRKPQEMAALSFLFDLPKSSARQAVSKNPLQIVERNREKLSPQFVAPGIRLIRRGEDCPQN